MKQIFLGIGSNLQNPLKKVSKALEMIAFLKGIFEFQASSLYETTPVSDLPQSNFINAVCTFYTETPPELLFEQLCAIEKSIGKVDKEKNEPRIIDIDLLLYGTFFQKDLNLMLPHPRMLERLFVLEPLYDLIPYIYFPLSKGKIREIDLESLIISLKAKKKDQVQKLFEESKFIFKEKSPELAGL